MSLLGGESPEAVEGAGADFGVFGEFPGVEVPEEFDESLSRLAPDRRHLKPLPLPEREVTAILLRTVSPLVSPGLRNSINEGQVAQAVMPIQVIYTLFQTIVGKLTNRPDAINEAGGLAYSSVTQPSDADLTFLMYL